MTTTILLVGSGNMGFAMLQGWHRSATGLTIYVIEPDDALRKRAAELGVAAIGSASDLPSRRSPDMIFLAVKPQILSTVASDYAVWADGRTTFASLAAGVTIPTLMVMLPGRTPIIRCMPNIAAAVGEGMYVCCRNGYVSDTASTLATQLLGASGKVAWIEDEKLMDAVTAVSGSGPAYVYHFIECLVAAGVKAGLPAELSTRLVLQTVVGAGLLAAQTSKDPEALRRDVTSPGGTTAAALSVLMEGRRMAQAMEDAVSAACRRSLELGTEG